MKEGFRKFKEMTMSEYPDILIKGIEENRVFNIYYFLNNFDIRDMQFHNFFGKSLNESFSKKEILNIASKFLLVEELEEYFLILFRTLERSFSLDEIRKEGIYLKEKLKISFEQDFFTGSILLNYHKFLEGENIQRNISFFEKSFSYLKNNQKKCTEINIELQEAA